MTGRRFVGLIPLPSPVVAEVASQDLVEIGVLPGVFENYYLVAASRKIENPISSQVMKTFTLRE